MRARCGRRGRVGTERGTARSRGAARGSGGPGGCDRLGAVLAGQPPGVRPEASPVVIPGAGPEGRGARPLRERWQKRGCGGGRDVKRKESVRRIPRCDFLVRERRSAQAAARAAASPAFVALLRVVGTLMRDTGFISSERFLSVVDLLPFP